MNIYLFKLLLVSESLASVLLWSTIALEWWRYPTSTIPILPLLYSKVLLDAEQIKYYASSNAYASNSKFIFRVITLEIFILKVPMVFVDRDI